MGKERRNHWRRNGSRVTVSALNRGNRSTTRRASRACKSRRWAFKAKFPAAWRRCAFAERCDDTSIPLNIQPYPRVRSYSDRVRQGKVDDHRIPHREPASAINVSPASVLSLIDFPRSSRPNGDRHRYVCARVRRCISILCNTGDPWIREIERTARQRKSGVFPLVKGRHIWTR